MAELSKSGRSTGESAGSAGTRPAASGMVTVSTAKGRIAERMRGKASSNSSMGHGRWRGPPAGGRSIAGGGEQGLFEGRDAFAHFVQRRHAKRFHAEGDGDLANFVGAGPLDDQSTNLIRHGHHLDDGAAAGVTG